MANSVDPDQTAPIVVSNARQLFQAEDFSRQHFQMHFFFLALLGLNNKKKHLKVEIHFYFF